MKILLTGGTGLIGRALCRALRARGDQLVVLSRRPQQVATRCGPGVEAWQTLAQWQPNAQIDAVINLAGEPIADRSWTAAQKARLLESRVGTTRQLLQRLRQIGVPPPVLLSGSAIGYYGTSDDSTFDESSASGWDFAASLCVQWERAANAATALGCRTVLLRTGLVLSTDGGLLTRIATPTRLGLGAVLGDGRQWMSWIHIDDYVRALLQLLDDASATGAYNLTAPSPATHRELVTTLAEVMHRPCLFNAPAPLLRPLLGERAVLLLDGQRVMPQRLLQRSFVFTYPELRPALTQLLRPASDAH